MNAPAHMLQLHGAIVDLVYDVDAVPSAGTEARVRDFGIAVGGGFNAMVAAKRSGLPVTYAGAVGTGPLGDMVWHALKAEGIHSLQHRDTRRDQGCCTVMIDNDNERTFVASEGAEGHLGDEDLHRIALSNFEWSLLSGYTLYYQGSRDAMTRWLTSNAKIPNLVFDPSPVIEYLEPGSIEAVLSRAAWVSANGSEAELLTGEADPVKAAVRLAQERSGGAVVRNGAEGCVVAWGDQHRTVPGHHVVTVDTNGAGDAHVGAFIAALARGQNPATAALYANVAAALSTTRKGPATAPELLEIEQSLRLRKAG